MAPRVKFFFQKYFYTRYSLPKPFVQWANVYIAKWMMFQTVYKGILEQGEKGMRGYHVPSDNNDIFIVFYEQIIKFKYIDFLHQNPNNLLIILLAQFVISGNDF
jgi:hypothetical protein